jgi:aldose 1-epimerase
MSLEIVTIKDSESGSEARIAVDFGFNCFDFRAVVEDQIHQVLWSADDFETGQARPSGSGIPLLFPFPGRLKGTKLPWENREFPLPEGDGAGNAIHGFVMNRPWRIVEQTDSLLKGEFQASVDDPDILNHWPADFKITATYEVVGSALLATYVVENPDEVPLPCGLGTHPYFQLPIGGTAADECQIVVPYTYEWVFKDKMATGDQTPRDTEPNTPIRFADADQDNAYGGLEFDGDQCVTTIHDPDSGRTITQTFSKPFLDCVLYNPPHREAFCIEPYTCVPDAFQLRRMGYPGGLKVLAPGETFEATVKIELT